MLVSAVTGRSSTLNIHALPSKGEGTRAQCPDGGDNKVLSHTVPPRRAPTAHSIFHPRSSLRDFFFKLATAECPFCFAVESDTLFRGECLTIPIAKLCYCNSIVRKSNNCFDDAVYIYSYCSTNCASSRSGISMNSYEPVLL